MASFLWAVLLLAGVASSSANTRSIQDYPGTVQVEFRGFLLWSQTCAGSILNNVYVLSSAKCFSGENYSVEDRRIRAGANLRGIGGQTIGVTSALNHPSYETEEPFSGDVALVRLASALVFSPTIAQVTIIAADSSIPTNLPVRTAGWNGRVISSATLWDSNLITIDAQACSSFHNIDATNAFCTTVDSDEEVVCSGNAGGAILYEQESGIIAVGVVSFDHGCGIGGTNRTVGVASSLTAFTNWIVENAV